MRNAGSVRSTTTTSSMPTARMRARSHATSSSNVAPRKSGRRGSFARRTRPFRGVARDRVRIATVFVRRVRQVVARSGDVGQPRLRRLSERTEKRPRDGRGSPSRPSDKRPRTPPDRSKIRATKVGIDVARRVPHGDVEPGHVKPLKDLPAVLVVDCAKVRTAYPVASPALQSATASRSTTSQTGE